MVYIHLHGILYIVWYAMPCHGWIKETRTHTIQTLTKYIQIHTYIQTCIHYTHCTQTLAYACTYISVAHIHVNESLILVARTRIHANVSTFYYYYNYYSKLNFEMGFKCVRESTIVCRYTQIVICGRIGIRDVCIFVSITVYK